MIPWPVACLTFCHLLISGELSLGARKDKVAGPKTKHQHTVGRGIAWEMACGHSRVTATISGAALLDHQTARV